MPQNWRQSEVCIVIDDKSQSGVAEHSSWGGLLHFKFTVQFAGERIFEIAEQLAKFQAKSSYTFVPKDAEIVR